MLRIRLIGRVVRCVEIIMPETAALLGVWEGADLICMSHLLGQSAWCAVLSMVGSLLRGHILFSRDWELYENQKKSGYS